MSLRKYVGKSEELLRRGVFRACVGNMSPAFHARRLAQLCRKACVITFTVRRFSGSREPGKATSKLRPLERGISM